MIQCNYMLHSCLKFRVNKKSKARSQNCQKRLLSICLSVRMEQLVAPVDGVPWNFIFEYFSKIIFVNISSGERVNLHDDLRTCTISRLILLRMRNVSDRSWWENQNTQFMLSNFLSENHTIYQIMWKNMVEPDRLQVTIRLMRFAYWLRLQIHTQNV